MVDQKGVLLGIKQLDFENDDKERVMGLKVVLARPAKDKRDGYGYVPFDLKDMSEEGMHRAAELAASCRDFWMQDVIVSCSVDLTGRYPRFRPVEIQLER